MAIIAPDVAPQPIPGVRLSPAADVTTFGGGPGLAAEGQEVQKIAASTGEIGALETIRAQKVAAFEQTRANQAAVQEAAANLSAVHTQLLTDPNSGLPAYRGVNAMAGQTKLWEQYQKSANDIYGTLHGQEQQDAFNKIALSSGESFQSHVQAHVHQELEQHDAATFEALVNNKANESGTTYGNAKALAFNNKLVDDAATARSQRLGLDDNRTEKFMRTVKTGYHEMVLGQMVNDPNFQDQAKAYFRTYQGEMSVDGRDRIKQLFDTVPGQQDTAAKANQTAFYKGNMRQAMMDMFDGKLTLSEAQRRFRENQLSESDYNQLAGKLSKPDAAVMQAFLVSKPETFNEIRQAQLTGSKSPGEIQRMIANGAVAKEITPDDGKYLLNVNSEKPPTPRDKQIEANANNLRDFGNRYFAESNVLGMPSNKDKTSQEAHALVAEFYGAVDKAKAKGEDIETIRDQVKKTAMQQRFPGLGNLDKAPDVVIDVKGKVIRLLNPDQRSGLAPKYRITPTGAAKEDDE